MAIIPVQPPALPHISFFYGEWQDAKFVSWKWRKRNRLVGPPPPLIVFHLRILRIIRLIPWAASLWSFQVQRASQGPWVEGSPAHGRGRQEVDPGRSQGCRRQCVLIPEALASPRSSAGATHRLVPLIWAFNSSALQHQKALQLLLWVNSTGRSMHGALSAE